MRFLSTTGSMILLTLGKGRIIRQHGFTRNAQINGSLTRKLIVHLVKFLQAGTELFKQRFRWVLPRTQRSDLLNKTFS
jgi:hypothetical protein